MTGVSFGVITRVGPGTLAAALDVRQVVETRHPGNDWTEVTEPVPPMVGLSLRRPVFTVGEILILGPDGRELGWPGRKPGKWDVDVEEFDTVDAAVDRAWGVLA